MGRKRKEPLVEEISEEEEVESEEQPVVIDDHGLSFSKRYMIWKFIPSKSYKGYKTYEAVSETDDLQEAKDSAEKLFKKGKVEVKISDKEYTHSGEIFYMPEVSEEASIEVVENVPEPKKRTRKIKRKL